VWEALNRQMVGAIGLLAAVKVVPFSMGGGTSNVSLDLSRLLALTRL